MDFFGAQDTARRKTWQLAALFGAAVLSLIVLTNLLIAAVYTWTGRPGPTGGLNLGGAIESLPASFWLLVSVGVLVVVGLASLYKYLRVRGGGRSIAEALGGRLVPTSSVDLRERRLLNVVEEMAIASGTPVPPVYLIDEPSINAFAAGFSPDDAVIGVNQGTLDHLSRDELQGVIAHEFSHILNGDSRLNLRLIAILHGILFIGLVGRGLLHGLSRGSRSRSSSGGGLPGLALGLGFVVIGYAGTFFGNLIKAAVSRQREFLADAASVQFTRNPGGIAGALKKIGGLGAGSKVPGAAAQEASHLFFGQPGRVFLNALMATHPPLERRILAVDPRWNGEYPVLAAGAEAAPGPAPAEAAAFAGATSAAAAGAAAGAPAEDALGILTDAEAVVAAVGSLDQQGLDTAAALIGGLPARLHDAARDPFEARALIYAVVLDAAPRQREDMLAMLEAGAEPGVPSLARNLLPQLAGLDEQQQLTLLELAMPALKELSEPQYRRFSATLVGLIKADRRIDLLEWVLHRLLVKELKPHFEGRQPDRARFGRLAALAAEAAVLLSALAREADGDGDAVAFAAGRTALGLALEPDTAADPDFARLNRALARLRQLKPLQKPRLIKACAATVLADGRASTRQRVLLQGIAAALDCPLPPTLAAAGGPAGRSAAAVGTGTGGPIE